MPLNAASVEQENEKIGTGVIPGNCVDMKRDHQYSTLGYYPVDEHVYNKTHNCENQSIADGFDGYVDMLVEQESNGSNLFHEPDVYLDAGDSFTRHDYTADNRKQYVSTSDWEIIDGDDGLTSKKIYASVE